jgi:hypothetical protein
MQAFLIVSGLLIMAIAFRTARRGWVRKLGAVAFLAASYALFFFLTDQWWGGVIGVVVWFFLPWVEILTRVKRMKLPMDNRLRHQTVPNTSFFPHAQQMLDTMESEGFDYAGDCCWEWSGMKQHYRMYYHQETRTMATLCLCEQSDVVFSFVSITSASEDGSQWRTTNYPFAETLQVPRNFYWMHVPCTRNCFRQIWSNHCEHLQKYSVPTSELMEMDPEHLDDWIEQEMQKMIEHNLDCGIIEFAGDGSFCYSTRGLFYLWGQFIKDMVRFC